jgi:phospholipid/cholesterol/gamma-HCH transport system substrate-binding protein
VFDNVDKLTPSNQIFLSGLAVGRVSDIRILQDEDNKVLVELEISSEIILDRKSSAILSGDLLGTKYLILDIGVVTNPLSPGDTINAVLDKGVAELLEENAVPVAANLQSTLRKLNTVLDNLASNTGKLDTILLDFHGTPYKIKGMINNINGKLAEITGEIGGVTKNLNSKLDQLEPTLANFKVLSDSLKEIEINGTLKKLQVSLGKMNETLTRMNSDDNTVGKLMTEDTLYHNLNSLLRSIDSLANHLNTNPKHFFGPLGKSQKKIERDLRKQQNDN